MHRFNGRHTGDNGGGVDTTKRAFFRSYLSLPWDSDLVSRCWKRNRFWSLSPEHSLEVWTAAPPHRLQGREDWAVTSPARQGKGREPSICLSEEEVGLSSEPGAPPPGGRHTASGRVLWGKGAKSDATRMWLRVRGWQRHGKLRWGHVVGGPSGPGWIKTTG